MTPQHSVAPCSRWDELVGTLHFHAGLAQAANAVTEFRIGERSGIISVISQMFI